MARDEMVSLQFLDNRINQEGEAAGGKDNKTPFSAFIFYRLPGCGEYFGDDFFPVRSECYALQLISGNPSQRKELS